MDFSMMMIVEKFGGAFLGILAGSAVIRMFLEADFWQLPGHFFLLDSGMKIWGMVELFTNLCGSF